jgi:hypothetical protein
LVALGEAVKETLAELLEDVVADTSVGALGDVRIVGDSEDALEVPPVFVAVTVNVYEVPLVNPVIVIGEDDPVAVIEPGELVTV